MHPSTRIPDPSAATMNIDGYALVTGAGGHRNLRFLLLARLIGNPGSGIGLACARLYAIEGAAGVAFADMNRASAEKAATESISIATNPDYRAIAIEVDVTDPEQVDNMVSKVSKEFGRIDYAVNSAGVSQLDDSVLHTPILLLLPDSC